MRSEHVEIQRRISNAYRDPAVAVLEGFHPARHADAFGCALELAVTADRNGLDKLIESVAPQSRRGIESVLVDVDSVLFERLCPRPLASPLLSIAPRPPVDVDALGAPNGKPLIHLEYTRNPGNVGAVVRVAAAADVAGVVVSGLVDPWSPVVIRSAAGLQYAVPVGTATPASLDGRPIVAVGVDGDPLDVRTLDPSSLLVFGGERHGLSDELLARADQTVTLPMRPGVSSLNLSTAVAAVLFAWRTSAQERNGRLPW